MFKIKWTSKYGTETVDEAETKREAEYLVREYNMAFNEGTVYFEEASNHESN